MKTQSSAWWFPAVAVAVHLWLTVVEWVGGPRILWGDEKAYLSSARAVLQGDPSWWPVPLWPPLYPRFLAGILAVSDFHQIAIAIVQTALLFVAAVIFGDLARRWTGSKTAGLAAFMMMAGFPPLAAFGRFLWPEVLHLVLVFAAVWVLSVRRKSLLWLVLAGVSLGLALLTKSLIGPFLPLLLGGAFIGDRSPRRLLRLSVCILASAVVVGPVMAIQYKRIGIPVIADSSAFNLWVGLNDSGSKSFENSFVAKAYKDYRTWGGTFLERNERLRRQSLEFIKSRGLATVLKAQLGRQYFRLFDKDSYLTEQFPGGAAVQEGAGYTSLEPKAAIALRWFVYGTYALLLVTAPLGFFVWKFTDGRWPRILLAFLVYNLALFLVLHVKSRYRIQVLPAFFLGSAAAVAWIEAGCPEWGRMKFRIACSTVLSVILLGLAF